MGASISLPSMLSAAQIEQFRKQAKAKREAAFLAPQLIEHIDLLNQQFKELLVSIDAIREAASELALAFDAGEYGASCPCGQNARIRAAMKRLCFAVGENQPSDLESGSEGAA